MRSPETAIDMVMQQITGQGERLRTYLALFVTSDGSKTSVIADKLNAVGFRALLGTHDFVYEWGAKTVTPSTVIELIDRVQVLLKGSNAIMHFVTE